MKVLFFQRIFAHYQWGLVRELAEHGKHEYSFYGDTSDPADSGIEVISQDARLNVAFTQVRTWQFGRRVAFQPAAVCVALIASYDALILEGAYAHPTTWAAILVAHLRRKRVLLYSHGWSKQSEPRWVSAIRTRFLRSADGILLYGLRAKAIGIARGVAAQRMHVVFNALDEREIVTSRAEVDDASVSAFRSRAFGDAQVPIVTYVGRVRKEKGLEQVLGALRRLRDRGVCAGFLVIGGGPAIKGLKQLSMELGIPAHFTGPEYEERTLALMLCASRVVVAPEAAGLSAVHAMSYGVPVITHSDFEHQRPEAEAIIPGMTGVLFDPGDESDLASALLRFLGPDYERSHWAPHCIRLVERWYNPRRMRQTFDRAVSGIPAQQLGAWPEHTSESDEV